MTREEARNKMQIMINIPEKLIYDGFERPFTEEEKNILIKAIGNGVPLPIGQWMNKEESLYFLQSCIDKVNLATAQDIQFYREMYDKDCAMSITESDNGERRKKMKTCNTCRFRGVSLTGNKLWKCKQFGNVKRFNVTWLHGWFCKYFKAESEG